MTTLSDYRREVAAATRWVVKIGSAMITRGGEGIDHERLAAWAAQMADMQRAGKQVMLVSSGAIAVGVKELGWSSRPRELAGLQTAAAVGQMRLARAWQEAFAVHDVPVAQVLLTHDDAADRKRYLNIRSTLQTMGKLGIVPVINENDTVAFEEIRFGDNDNLGALVANVSNAEAYLILTDQQGMYNKNPREHADAVLLDAVRADDPALASMAGKTGGALGSGGMYTKVLAAQKAARSGTHTLLAYGQAERVIARVAAGEALGTLFVASGDVQQARKQWLGSRLQIQGQLTLDDGAVRALVQQGKSLLPVGVRAVSGAFQRGALVACLDGAGQEIARGLVNYDSDECAAFAGQHSDELGAALIHGDALIHRDNLVLS